MRILVCGGRDYNNWWRVKKVLDNLVEEHAPDKVVIVHGDAPGADTLADRWAELRGHDTAKFPADWGKYGRSAGPIRNREMLYKGSPDIAVSFPGGRGTEHMKSLIRGARIKLLEVAHD